MDGCAITENRTHPRQSCPPKGANPLRRNNYKTDVAYPMKQNIYISPVSTGGGGLSGFSPLNSAISSLPPQPSDYWF